MLKSVLFVLSLFSLVQTAPILHRPVPKHQRSFVTESGDIVPESKIDISGLFTTTPPNLNLFSQELDIKNYNFTESSDCSDDNEKENSTFLSPKFSSYEPQPQAKQENSVVEKLSAKSTAFNTYRSREPKNIYSGNSASFMALQYPTYTK